MNNLKIDHRTVPGLWEQLFAEFLLQGGVSLFRYYYGFNNYFGFVGSDGKEIILRDDKLNEDLTTY